MDKFIKKYKSSPYLRDFQESPLFRLFGYFCTPPRSKNEIATLFPEGYGVHASHRQHVHSPPPVPIPQLTQRPSTHHTTTHGHTRPHPPHRERHARQRSMLATCRSGIDSSRNAGGTTSFSLRSCSRNTNINRDDGCRRIGNRNRSRGSTGHRRTNGDIRRNASRPPPSPSQSNQRQPQAAASHL